MQLPVPDWPIIMISPGDLLLVVSHQFAVPVLVLWDGVGKKFITKLECEEYFCMCTVGDALSMIRGNETVEMCRYCRSYFRRRRGEKDVQNVTGKEIHTDLDRSRGEFNTDGRFGFQAELIPCKSGEQIGLPDSRISDQNYLEKIIILIIRFVSHFSVACSFLCFPIRRSAGGRSNIAAIHRKSRDALHDHPSCTWNPADKIMSWKKVSTKTDQMTKGYDKFKKRKKNKQREP